MLILASATSIGQYAVDGFVNGSSYAILGLSFGLVIAVCGRFHFAWAAAYALAGFLAAYLNSHNGLAPVPAVLIGLAAATVFNILVELLVYRPVVKRAGTQHLLAVFVASFGLFIAIPNLISWRVGPTATGGETLTWISTRTIHAGKITFLVLDIVSVIVLWALGIGTWALLRYTPLGRRIRAVQVNPQMSEAVGINSGRTYLAVFTISALLAGVAAMIFSMRYTATPDMGTTPVFYAFVVAFAAGLGRSPIRIMVIGSLIGIVEGISAQWLSVSWQQIVVFAILLIYLVFKAANTWRPDLVRLPSVTRPSAEGG